MGPPRGSLIRVALAFAAVGFATPRAAATDAPAHLPQYDLTIQLDTAQHRTQVRERVTWTNTTKVPVSRLAFKDRKSVV